MNWESLLRIAAQTLPVVGIALSLATYLQAHPKRGLRYAASRLHREEIEGSHLYTLILRLRNDGREAIAKDDFDEPISFEFSATTVILSAFVMHVRPANIRPEIRINKTTVVLSPLLINPGDHITLRFSLRCFDRSVDVHSRIKGIKAIPEKPEPALGWILATALTCAIPASMMSPFMLSYVWPIGEEPWWIVVIFFATLILYVKTYDKAQINRRLEIRKGYRPIPYDKATMRAMSAEEHRRVVWESEHGGRSMMDREP